MTKNKFNEKEKFDRMDKKTKRTCTNNLQNKSNFCKVFGTVQMLFFSSHFKLKKNIYLLQKH